MEELLGGFARVTSQLSEAAAVIIIAGASLEAFLRLLWMVATVGATHGERKAIWQRFGESRTGG